MKIKTPEEKAIEETEIKQSEGRKLEEISRAEFGQEGLLQLLLSGYNGRNLYVTWKKEILMYDTAHREYKKATQ